MIGNKIKIIRSKFGINQTELANKLDIKQATLSDIENNKTIPSYKVLKGFYDNFGLNLLGYILSDDESIEKFEEMHKSDANTAGAFAKFERLNDEEKSKVQGYMEKMLEDKKAVIIFKLKAKYKFTKADNKTNKAIEEAVDYLELLGNVERELIPVNKELFLVINKILPDIIEEKEEFAKDIIRISNEYGILKNLKELL